MKTAYTKALEDVAQVAEVLVAIKYAVSQEGNRWKQHLINDHQYKSLLGEYHRKRVTAEKSMEEAVDRLDHFQEWQALV